MNPTVVKITAPAVYQTEGYKVYLRERWEDPWQEAPGLYCNWATWSAAPTISSAEFERRYGEGMLETENAFSYKDYLNRGTWWVKVEIEQSWDNFVVKDGVSDPIPGDPLTWIGIIEVDGDNPAGSPNAQPMGVQKYLAYGPEILLERSIMTTTRAWWLGKGGDTEVVHYEAVPFNEFMRIQAADRLAKKEFQNRPGNRSRIANPDGVYPFADPKEADEEQSMAAWDAKTIIDHLLYYHGPQDKNGDPTIHFALASDEYLPSGICHEIKRHGVATKHVLDQLLDRRRLLSYVIEPDPDAPDKFVVRPFSFLDQAIDLDDLTLWENADQKILEVDDAVLIEGLSVQESWCQFYHRVVAVGAPIVCCGTFADSSSLVAAWTDAEAASYTTATTAAAGYDALEPSVKEEHNTTFRKEERFERVYAAFGLSHSKSCGWCGDRYSIHPLQTFFPDTLFGDANKCGPDPWVMQDGVYLPSLRLSKALPLRSDHDYRGDKIDTDAVQDNTPAGVNWHYHSPLIIVRLPDPDHTGPDDGGSSAPGRFVDIAHAGDLRYAESMGWGAGIEFSASVHIPENTGYFQLKLLGAAQNVLAKNLYTAPANLGYYEPEPLLDWRNDLLATLAVETQCRVQVQWPESVADETDNLRTLWLDLSDYAALHYVAPQTVVAVEDGKLIRTNAGGIIRDDRPLLKRMARMAYEWYSRRRQALHFSYKGAKKYFRIGDLITEMGSGATREPIRSVVTQIRVDLGRTPGDAHHTTIETQWAELDVLRLLA